MPVMAAFSSTLMVTSKVPVRPLPCSVKVSAPSGMPTSGTSASAAGSATGSSVWPWLADQARFTAAMTPLLLMVAPVTVSMSPSATRLFRPMNCARNLALSFTWPRKGTSSGVLASPTAMPVMAAFSSTLMVTSKVPFRPLPCSVKVSAPSGMPTSGTSASAAASAA